MVGLASAFVAALCAARAALRAPISAPAVVSATALAAVVALCPPRALAAVRAFVPVLAAGDAVPAVRLTAQDGAPFDFQRFRGQTLVVGFTYTRCRDAGECPLVSAKLARLQAAARDAPIHLVELSVDPLHDDRASLARYGAAFGAEPARWTLATGPVADVAELERRLGVEVSPVPGSDEIAHTELLVFVGPDGRVVDRLGGANWTPDEVLAHARAIAGLSADPFARLQLALTRGLESICGGGVSGISLAAAVGLFVTLSAAMGYTALRASRT